MCTQTSIHDCSLIIAFKIQFQSESTTQHEYKYMHTCQKIIKIENSLLATFGKIPCTIVHLYMVFSWIFEQLFLHKHLYTHACTCMLITGLFQETNPTTGDKFIFFKRQQTHTCTATHTLWVKTSRPLPLQYNISGCSTL